MGIKATSLILVVVINNPRDFEIARVLGWYRIPLRTAPKVIAVDHLAFYQTSAFGDEKWRICYTAPVKGYELTSRLELLKDESDHPNTHHEYFKIQLGPLELLPAPIIANKWRRITFFYTTGEYLSSANSVEEMVIKSQERQTLWRALRERMDQSQADILSNEPIPEILTPEVISLFFGIKEPGDIEE